MHIKQTTIKITCFQFDSPEAAYNCNDGFCTSVLLIDFLPFGTVHWYLHICDDFDGHSCMMNECVRLIVSSTVYPYFGFGQSFIDS